MNVLMIAVLIISLVALHGTSKLAVSKGRKYWNWIAVSLVITPLAATFILLDTETK